MNILYRKTLDGVCIQRCYGLDGNIQLPQDCQGLPVRELERYVFSETVRGREIPPKEREGEGEIAGSQLTELTLPASLRRIGAYAFYNCTELRRLCCHSTVEDWGAGVFTGCTGIKQLDICIHPGEKSCFKEILSELRQTLTVDYRDEKGTLRAKLVFPEYFEESVENTPARIIMREMHGCGHMYRYSFSGQEFQFREYDSLFPHVQVQEKPELVTKLALYRLYWPWELSEAARENYWAFVREYAGEAAAGLVKRGEYPILSWAASLPQLGSKELEQMTEACAQLSDAQASAILLDARHKRSGGKDGVEKQMERTFFL